MQLTSIFLLLSVCKHVQKNDLHIYDVELFDWLVFNACMTWRYFIGLFLIDVADSTQPGMQSPDPFPCEKLSLYAQDEKTRFWLHRLLSNLKGRECWHM